MSMQQPARLVAGSAKTRWLVACVVALSAPAAGCSVVTYHPVSGLQRPTAISVETSNLSGTRMLVRCLPSEALQQKAAQRLCERVRTLFANQGADVHTTMSRSPAQDEAAAKDERPDLVVEMRARLLHVDRHPWLAILSGLTLTLIPSIGGFTFAQDVVVLDGDGFQLASETLQGRFVSYFGVGVWAVNKTLDLLVRPDEEELTGDAAHRDFSADFYRQMSQVAFNARMRAQVMRAFEPPVATPKRAGAMGPPPGAQ